MDDALPLLTADELDGRDVARKYNLGYNRRFSDAANHPTAAAWRKGLYSGLLLLLWLSTAVLSSTAWHYHEYSQRRHITLYGAQKTFSPAQSAIEYIVQTFQQNITEVPLAFQDPNTADLAWDDLYNDGFRSIISKEEAILMPNETWWVEQGGNGTGAEGYVVTLSVYHELHCLDLIRHALEPQYDLKTAAAITMTSYDHLSPANDVPSAVKPIQPTRYADLRMSDLKDHLNHCLHSLRQAISCHSDISVGVWQWEDSLSDYKPNFRTEHTCRNFEKIQEWARSRSFQLK